MNGQTIYLCGPIADRTDEQCVNWRAAAETHWKGKTLNPLRRDYRGVEIENCEQLVKDDLNDIDNSDGLIVWFDAPSVGTAMEIFYANTVRKIPIVVVDSRADKACKLSPWLIYHTDGIAESLYEGLGLLHELIASKEENA